MITSHNAGGSVAAQLPAEIVERLLSGDKVVSVDQAAAISGLSASTLKRRARAGDLKLLKLSPRRVGVRLSELGRFLEGCTV
jgi:hypothetical protein